MPTNLYRTPSGYIFRKVIPKLLQRILGKTEIKIPCGKTYAEALAKYPVAAVRAQQDIANARANIQIDNESIKAARLRLLAPVANLKPITVPTPELVEQLRGLWLSGLEHDLTERSQGLDDEDFELLSINISEMQATLSNAMARGKVEVVLPSLHQLLFMKGYVLALNPEDERKLAYDFLQAVVEGYEILQKRQAGVRAPTPQVPILLENRPGEMYVDAKPVGLTLGKIIEEFLENYPKSKESMLKKHSVALPLLGQLIGNDKPLAQLRQTDLNQFFAKIQKLPPRWPDVCRRHKISAMELIGNEELRGLKGLAPKTFFDSYRACVSGFLKTAKRDYQDQGFPVTLTTEAIAYKGGREEGENAQRAMRPEELKRLFQGPEMESFAGNATKAYQYWFLLVGLFTGARVNELCQINPQTDILKEPKSNIWYLWITDETAADERIEKSTKNMISKRKVPIHPTLLALGILDYVQELQRQGAMLLFPKFPPQRGRASPRAEKWFRELIKKTGLRDETPFARLAGHHTFRSTLLAEGLELELDLTPITGHAGGVDPTVRKYQGELSLSNKLKRLRRIKFPVEFIRPVKLTMVAREQKNS